MTVAQSTPDASMIPHVLSRFMEAVGGIGRIRIQSHPSHPSFRKESVGMVWCVEDFQGIQAVAVQLWPFLSEVKRRQVLSMLEGLAADRAEFGVRRHAA